MTIIKLPLFLAALLLGGPVHAQTRILCIGDSITQGGARAGEHTYRVPLQKMLPGVDFIGTQRAGLTAIDWPPGFDPDHEGHYGATSAEVRAKLAAALPQLPAPDVALIYLGWNDQQGGTAEALEGIVTQLRGRNPRVVILIGEIALGGWRGVYTRFAVRRLAARLHSDAAPVIAVDHAADWDPKADTFDGAHPSASGQAKMAAAWHRAISDQVAFVSSISTSAGPLGAVLDGVDAGVHRPLRITGSDDATVWPLAPWGVQSHRPLALTPPRHGGTVAEARGSGLGLRARDN